MSKNYPLFVKRDLDGFFGLFIDNLVQLLAIVYLCASNVGMTGENSSFLYERILPGAAASILIGNLFYAWQAHRLAAATGRSDITALPYGINTPSLLVYIFFVMAPAYRQAVADGKTPHDATELAWQLGLVACLGSGLIELAGSFIAGWVRRHTPRAALLSTLAGIAIGFISMTFALQLFQSPLRAMLPLAIVLVTYFSRTSFPLGLPGGLIAVVAGTAIAWFVTVLNLDPASAPGWVTEAAMKTEDVKSSLQSLGFFPPRLFAGELFEVLSQPLMWTGFLSVIVPMGLFNIVGSLQNIESAEAAGDRFATGSSMAVNGVGTIVAALFGSCFPTTIYIGHPGWKGLGARAGYSTLNGLAITLIALTGSVAVINSIVPMEAGIAIVLWIGIIITAQAFQTTPCEHAPAVAVGLFPAIAAWGQTVVQGAFFVAGGVTIQKLLVENPTALVNGFLIHGMFVLERGYIFTCMILAALSACLIDRKFYAAAIWSLVGAAFALIGLTHAYQIQGNALDFLYMFQTPSAGALAYRATGIAVGYLMCAVAFAGMGWYASRHPREQLPGH